MNVLHTGHDRKMQPFFSAACFVIHTSFLISSLSTVPNRLEKKETFKIVRVSCFFYWFDKQRSFCKCSKSINGTELELWHRSGTWGVQDERHWLTPTLTCCHWIPSPEQCYRKWPGRPISYFNRLKLLKYTCTCFYFPFSLSVDVFERSLFLVFF